MTHRVLAESSEWTFDLIERYDQIIGRAAADYGLDTYPIQYEVIGAEQMMDAYASVGMPIGYHHWSFGKQFLEVERNYRRGRMGLAYEIVINSSPCITYLMEENTATMQALVMAHAAYGHNAFFKGNELFRAWTSADAIIDYLVFAKRYIGECERRHGELEVELLLDGCHALMDYGVASYRRPPKLSAREEARRQEEREEYEQQQVNDLWRTLPERESETGEKEEHVFPAEPEENLLYFIEKHAPLLEPWQREVIRIVRKLAQYFYPQRQTKIMNEGFACFWHYTLLNTVYDRGYLSDGFMVEFLESHTNVVHQPAFHEPQYQGINPYALGFAMMRDIRRICEQPTDEDREWFPWLAGTDWLEAVDFAMRNFRDESFISQYLSPRLIREFKLFAVVDDEKDSELQVSAIHDQHGYAHVRRVLAEQHNLRTQQPDIQVSRVDLRGDRSLTIRHRRHLDRPIHESADAVLEHVGRLWGFTVRLEEVDDKERVIRTRECPASRAP